LLPMPTIPSWFRSKPQITSSIFSSGNLPRKNIHGVQQSRKDLG
jgi:hypothetical protein